MCWGLPLHASVPSMRYRDFWYPLFHAERLDYCLTDNQQCGQVVANRYCRLMGYRHAKAQQIDYNVGLTHYLGERKQCKGWQCNGFKLITCEGAIQTSPKAEYLQHTHKFVFPRANNYRVAWCYKKDHDCGQRAAYSFCRHAGYGKATQYTIQKKLPATQSLGDHQLCFGQDCQGFASITCFR
jgi:hypothetical protein